MMDLTNIIKNSPIEFSKRYAELHTYVDRKDFHPEANLLEHVHIVANRCLATGDPDLVMAALLHDICKEDTKELNLKTGNWTSPGHETAAAELIIRDTSIHSWIMRHGGDVGTVVMIVRYHMRMKSIDSMGSKKRREMERMSFFPKLKAFRFADSMLLDDGYAVDEMFKILR